MIRGKKNIAVVVGSDIYIHKHVCIYVTCNIYMEKGETKKTKHIYIYQLYPPKILGCTNIQILSSKMFPNLCWCMSAYN